METIDILRLIAAKAPSATHEALGAIRGQQVGSPLAARRAERAASMALEDPQAEWTAEERLLLASLLGADGPDEEPRRLDLRIRVNEREKAIVQRLAEDAGMTVSDFIRSKIGL